MPPFFFSWLDRHLEVPVPRFKGRPPTWLHNLDQRLGRNDDFTDVSRRQSLILQF
jgi:hypothetical protein